MDTKATGGASTCATGLASCGDACADTASDPANCGACGQVCGKGASCVTGVCAGPACSGTIEFRGKSGVAADEYATNQAPIAVAAADLNGDDLTDLVVANLLGGTVTVLFNQGDGTFARAYEDLFAYGAIAVTTADLNGDGKVDLAIASAPDAVVTVLFNDGSGHFQVGGKIHGNVGSIAAADLNGDGKIDLVTIPDTKRKVTVLLNEGDGTFAAGVDYATSNGTSTWDVAALAVGDLNGDGKPDIVAGYAFYSGAGLTVLFNEGDGTFGSPLGYIASAFPGGIALGDLNGDGMPDIATARGSEITVLLNQGNNTFADPVQVPITGGGGALARVDVNGDGKADLVLRNHGAVRVLLNEGAGQFADPLEYPMSGEDWSGSTPLAVAAADLNGDGRPDVAFTSVAHGGVGVFFNVCHESN